VNEHQKRLTSEHILEFTPKQLLGFWSRVNKNGRITTHNGDIGCCWDWVFQAKRYGSFYVNGKMEQSNRVSWMIHFGEIPEGLDVCHKCDNGLCVNPDHIFLGTHTVNMRDMMKKERRKSSKGIPKSNTEQFRRGENHPWFLKPEIIPRGENQGNAKLTDEKVLKIRTIYAAGEATQCGLAASFGVHQGTISGIVLRKPWTHI